MPKITVIITAHNERGWLDEAINSAKNQTFKDYEIILASDGNMDLIRYAEKHGIRWCYSPKHSFMAAFNLAVTQAKGKWIKGLHDDDLLVNTCLENLCDCRNDADLVYANAFEFNDETYTVYKSPDNVTIESLLPVITNPIHGGTLLIRRETLLKLGGLDVNLPQTEDYELYLNLLLNGYRLSYCNEIVAWFRLHPGQTSKQCTYEIKEQEKEYILQKHSQLNNLI